MALVRGRRAAVAGAGASPGVPAEATVSAESAFTRVPVRRVTAGALSVETALGAADGVGVVKAESPAPPATFARLGARRLGAATTISRVSTGAESGCVAGASIAALARTGRPPAGSFAGVCGVTGRATDFDAS